MQTSTQRDFALSFVWRPSALSWRIGTVAQRNFCRRLVCGRSLRSRSFFHDVTSLANVSLSACSHPGNIIVCKGGKVCELLTTRRMLLNVSWMHNLVVDRIVSYRSNPGHSPIRGGHLADLEITLEDAFRTLRIGVRAQMP